MHHYHINTFKYFRQRNPLVSDEETLKLIQAPVFIHSEQSVCAYYSFLTSTGISVVILPLAVLALPVLVDAEVYTILKTHDCRHYAFPTFNPH